MNHVAMNGHDVILNGIQLAKKIKKNGLGCGRPTVVSYQVCGAAVWESKA